MGKLRIFFRADLPERKKRFPSWAGAEKFAVDLNFGEKTGILVATGPGPRQIEVTTSFYERSNSGCAVKPKKISKTTSRHQNAVEYIAGKSLLFISFKKK